MSFLKRKAFRMGNKRNKRANKKANRKQLLLMAEKARLKRQNHPELFYIVDYECKETNEVFLQLSVRVWNELIQKIISNSSTEISLMELKHALSFTKDVSASKNVLKPHIQK